MPTPDANKILPFATPQALNDWLKSKHDSETELWVKIFKKSTKIESVTWNDVVIESLCWGWIDGIKKSLDDKAYLQRITPRKTTSNWSRINTKHVERLITEDRMQESGMVHVRAAKTDGRWENAYAPASEMKVPEDFLVALDKEPKSKQFYDTLNKSSRYAIAYGLDSAKKPETRQRRFQKFLEMLASEVQPGFGFKKDKK